MYKVHRLKTDKDVFQQSWDGSKNYEIRFDDRDFQVGDKLILEETKHTGEEMANGCPLVYTGRQIECKVKSYLTGKYGLQLGWCVMGISVMWLNKRGEP